MQCDYWTACPPAPPSEESGSEKVSGLNFFEHLKQPHGFLLPQAAPVISILLGALGPPNHLKDLKRWLDQDSEPARNCFQTQAFIYKIPESQKPIPSCPSQLPSSFLRTSSRPFAPSFFFTTHFSSASQWSFPPIFLHIPISLRIHFF